MPSVPVVPQSDPTLLFINAGMNQFKDIFLNKRKPSYVRAVNSQKCIRVSGKHNDLEEVGYSNRHHTFFEMLGNWSFGDYYKTEAIKWAWELVSEIWKFPKDRLYATVYLDDDEAERIWREETDIDPSHISRFGKKDNFWEMGEIGPCGPCSEIHFDMGADGCDKKEVKHRCEVNGVCGRILEIWNLVFIQYNRDERGNLHELPDKHIDTGAGLERITTILQSGTSNYDCDLFQPIIRRVEELSGVSYSDKIIPHRVISDHLRALAFAIADGALPSNEGRGYVLRRILRRASRFGTEIGLNKPFIYKLVPSLVDIMGDIYPELSEKHQHITLTIKSEEEGFTATLERGIEIFNSIIEKMSINGENVIPGEDAFRLYDTFGFPLDLTQLMAREKGFKVDIDGFERAMSGQRARARAGGKFILEENKNRPYTNLMPYADEPPEEWQIFVGYDHEDYETDVVKYRDCGDCFEVVVKESPFYAEAGGQVGDTGIMTLANGTEFRVNDSYFDESSQRVLKVSGNYSRFVASISGSSRVKLSIDSDRRMAIRRNHTATHLLHLALRQTLGEHVQQAGSLVHPDYLRFDYTHYQKPNRQALLRVERMVNENIMLNHKVSAEITTLEEARARGAMALFGEKYGEKVRMISVDDISRELCGGTHCSNSGDIGSFRITSETGVSSGIRRIEAVTGYKALELQMEEREALEDIREILNSYGSDVVEKLKKFAEGKKELEKELLRLRRSGRGLDLESLISKAEVVDGAKIVATRIEATSLDELKELGDVIRERLKSGIGFIGANIGGKAGIVCVVTDDLINRGINAGTLVGVAAKSIGGGGGGRAHLATAGAKSAEKLDFALREAIKIAEKALK